MGDHWLINGTKIFITNAGPADIYVIFAMTDKEKGNRGISAFILEKGTPGFSIGKHEEKMGIRGSVTAELVFEDVKLPKENLLGELNKGFKIAMMTLYGGYGYTRDYPIERMMRDAKITEIYEGTSEVQMMVISSWMGVK